MKPQKIDDALLAFPASVSKLMIPYKDIPEEFKDSYNKWAKIQRDWFFKGLSDHTEFLPKEGIDANTAIRHLMAIQRSYEPKHEHKEACVAYLMSLWFDDVKY